MRRAGLFPVPQIHKPKATRSEGMRLSHAVLVIACKTRSTGRPENLLIVKCRDVGSLESSVYNGAALERKLRTMRYMKGRTDRKKLSTTAAAQIFVDLGTSSGCDREILC